MSDGKTKGKRICGTCHKPGHNSRTCPVKKAMAAGGAPPSQPQITETTISVTPTALAPTGADAALPTEFEGAFRSLRVGDTSLRIEVRETAQGLNQMTMRVEQRDRATGSDRITDLVIGNVEVAGKMLELLHWALQRHVVRAKMAKMVANGHVNGITKPAPAATATT